MNVFRGFGDLHSFEKKTPRPPKSKGLGRQKSPACVEIAPLYIGSLGQYKVVKFETSVFFLIFIFLFSKQLNLKYTMISFLFVYKSILLYIKHGRIFEGVAAGLGRVDGLCPEPSGQPLGVAVAGGSSRRPSAGRGTRHTEVVSGVTLNHYHSGGPSED